jgi:tRNA (cytidine/uridine-2'-O-)-methyltransferase
MRAEIAGSAPSADGPDAGSGHSREAEAVAVSPLFEVVLHEPLIPNNTGNIGRTCVALGASLHLIHPIGFDLSEKACRRAGLDYWPRLDVHEHESWAAYLQTHDRPMWLFTTGAGTPVFDVPLGRGDHLVFGKETAGLPQDLLDAHPERVVCLPMKPGERSLNLATAVCAALYEGLGQVRERGGVSIDANGRIQSP